MLGRNFHHNSFAPNMKIKEAAPHTFTSLRYKMNIVKKSNILFSPLFSTPVPGNWNKHVITTEINKKF